MKKLPIADNKRDLYEQVIQIHFEKGPVEHKYTYGFLSELIEDAQDLIDGSSRVEYVSPAVNICGDIRSRYGDLLDVFKVSDQKSVRTCCDLDNFSLITDNEIAN